MVALLGVVMRIFPILSVPFTYSNLLHAHSHVAFQGWVYLSFFYIITTTFISRQDIIKNGYKLQFLLTTTVIVGILISFIYQGYGFFSILFSTLFQLMSYWFVARFFIDVKKNTLLNQHSLPVKYIKTGLMLYVLSTLAPWAIGIISAKGLAGSELYHSTIYFFLHFQFNGYFTFAALGILIYHLDNHGKITHTKHFNIFFYLLTASVVPAYFLMLLGMTFRNNILIYASIASIMQLIALVYFAIAILPNIKPFFKQNTRLTKTLILIFVFSFFVKTLLQSISVLTIFQNIAFGNRYIIMSFIHLTLIGFITFSLLVFFKLTNIFKNTTAIKYSLWLIIVGFVFSELFITLHGFGYQTKFSSYLILIFSILMLIGIASILTSLLKK